MNRAMWPHLALFSVALIYGANYVIAKVVLDDQYIGPLGFILMRVLMATALFWTVGLRRTSPTPEPKDLFRLALCGVLGVAANQMFFFSGLALTSPIHASLIMVLTPLLVYVLGALIEWRPLHIRSGLGITLAGAGAVWLILRDQDAATGSGHPLGDLFVAINATAYALYLILVRPLMQTYPPIVVMKWVFLFGTFVVVLFGWEQALTARWTDFTLPVALSFAYVLLFTTFVAYGLNAYALQHVASVTVSAYIYLQPVIASVLALFLGTDVLDINKIGAAMAIFTGVWLVTNQEAHDRR
jgi:drug/metabolite transporter (DMT)-like permease